MSMSGMKDRQREGAAMAAAAYGEKRKEEKKFRGEREMRRRE